MKFEEFKSKYMPQDIIELAGELENYPGDVQELVDSLRKTDKMPLLVEIVRTLALFTGGSVASVRDPSQFDPEKAKQGGLGGQLPHLVQLLRPIIGKFMDAKQTKDNYKVANYILELLAQSDAKKPWHATQDVYRGMHSLSANAFLALCKPGAVYSLGKIVSTTVDKGVADKFTKAKPRYRLVYILNNSKAKKGVYTGRSTSAYASEQEVIIGGKIRILKFEIKPTYEDIDPFDFAGPYEEGTITDFDKLLKYVQVIENFNSNKNAEIGGMTVYAEVLP